MRKEDTYECYLRVCKEWVISIVKLVYFCDALRKQKLPMQTKRLFCIETQLAVHTVKVKISERLEWLIPVTIKVVNVKTWALEFVVLRV